MKKSNHKTKVICIILTYNCATLVAQTFKNIPKKGIDKIILVDDGSSDNTMEVARKLGITSFSHKHLGYGGNIKFALNKALEMGADYMIEVHGDGQYDPSIIPSALEEIRKGYVLLLGSRFVDKRQPLKDGMPLERYIANILLSYFYQLILRTQLTEFHTGFHIYTKKFLNSVGFTNTSNGHIYSLEIIFQAIYKKLPITEVPIRCNYKKKHTSISIKNSIIYSFQSIALSFEYILAKVGIKRGIFKTY